MLNVLLVEDDLDLAETVVQYLDTGADPLRSCQQQTNRVIIINRNDHPEGDTDLGFGLGLQLTARLTTRLDCD